MNYLASNQPWPTGAVTFLFADIEESTSLWDRHRSAMRPALAEHDALLRTAVTANGGVIVKTTGDGALAAFTSPSAALAAALDAQRALQRATWPTIKPDKIRVRMGLHTGEAELREGDYYGTAVNRAARLMSISYGGQVLLSGTTAQLIEGSLPDTINLLYLGEYRLKGLTRPAQVFQAQTVDLPHDFPSLQTAEITKDNLPQPLTSFVGREAELSQLTRFFADPDIHLVTILGPGGMGKTQLSIEWARGQAKAGRDGQARYRDGIYFVDLAPLESPDQFVPAMAEVFAFPLQGERRSPEKQILDYLRQKNLLLILDNFEHITDASDFVGDILLAAPGVRILVTSRERLHLRSEQVYAIEGLPYPPASLPDDADLTAYTAVQLLIRSARRVRPDFELAPNDRQPAARICRYTAGMPLAIELAAAWLDLLPIGELADEIEQRFDLLETDMRDIPLRHRSIRAAIDTTWEYLGPDEQQTFARLSVFRGSFTWEAAATVLSKQDDKLVFRRTLAALSDKSLIVYNARADHFTIHELLRQYGAEKLRTTSQEEELTAILEQHAHYYARLLAGCESGLKGAQFVESLRLIESDLENILVAWDWLLENGRRLELAVVMDSLGLFLEMQGYLSIGHRKFSSLAARWQAHLAEAETNTHALTDDLRFLAKVLAWQSVFERDRHKAVSLLQDSFTLLDDPHFDEQPSDAERAFASYRLGLLLRSSQVKRAKEFLEQGVTLYQGLNDLWGVASCLLSLGFAASLASPETGCRYLLQAAEVFEKSGDIRGLVQSLAWLTVVTSTQGDDQAMEKAFNRLLTLVDDQEQPFLPEETLIAKFFVSTERGQYPQDLAYREELAAYYQELGRISLRSRVHLAYSYLHNGQFEKGRALLIQTRRDLEETAVENDYRLAFCFHILATLALAEDDFENAALYLQKAKVIYEINNNLPDIAGAHSLTGLTLVGQGDLDAARPRLLAGLKITLEIKGVILLGESFLAIALLLAHQGEFYRARELYELIWRLPRFQKSALYDAMAGKKIRTLTSNLAPEDLDRITHQTADRDPWQEAAALFEQLSAQDWAN